MDYILESLRDHSMVSVSRDSETFLFFRSIPIFEGRDCQLFQIIWHQSQEATRSISPCRGVLAISSLFGKYFNIFRYSPQLEF